ncbi:MAG: hypothetical protein OEY69_00085 [Candidatus Krumholzibacteria bacterium]|nr:hypothetical protein [Candidatus Krumholzibacteria bacterium]
MSSATMAKGEMSILDESGDTRLIWSEDNQPEVDAAKTMFASLKKKGYLAYAVDKKGEKGRVMDEFDPSAEKIIMSPQMQGG